MPKQETIKPVPQAQYIEITKLLETEQFDKTNKDFARIYGELEKISKMKGLGKVSDARKAMKTIERSMDLLRELLRRKYEIAEKGGVSASQGKK